MTESRRRGACPGLSAPMQTGDGLLARLIPAAPVPLDAMAGFCAAACRHGNGIIEVTARGSLQVRGLTPRSAPLFAAAVGKLGIAVQEGIAVIAGCDDGGVDLLAAALRRAIAAARPALSPKVSIVVDGDGPLHLDALPADVRLRVATAGRDEQYSPLRFHLGLGGDASSATWFGAVALKDAVAALLHILTAVAARGPSARVADILAREGVAAFRAIPGVDPALAPAPRMPADVIGLHAMRNGMMAAGVGLVFGHTHADALAELVRIAALHGVRAAQPVPDRAMLLTGVSALTTCDLVTAAERLGFMVRADDPRRRIAACPGAPACASGLIPARALAGTLAPVIAPLLPPERHDVFVHISGCCKGCAHPAPAALTLVGTSQGCGVIHNGSASETPVHYTDPARLIDDLGRPIPGSAEDARG